MVVGGTALERMIFFFKAGLFLHPKRSAFILTSELTAADERPARSSYLSPSRGAPATGVTVCLTRVDLVDLGFAVLLEEMFGL